MHTHKKREDSGEREKAASHTQPSSAGHGARPLGLHAGITQVQSVQQRNHEGPVPGATPSAVLVRARKQDGCGCTSCRFTDLVKQHLFFILYLILNIFNTFYLIFLLFIDIKEIFIRLF